MQHRVVKQVREATQRYIRKSIMLIYQSHNMTDLWFYLLEADSAPGPVRVLKQKHLRRPNYQLDLRIIGNSHIISLKTAFTQLTECLACLPTRDIKTKTLMECPLPLSDSEFRATVGHFQYSVKFHTAWLEQDEYRKRHLLLLENTNESLCYEFPAREGMLKLNPLTLLKYSCQATLVQIWTYHTYPDECGIADTHTEIGILQP